MEYKRSDLYVQAERQKKDVWREQTKPVNRAEVELGFEVDLEMERPLTMERMAESCPVPPMGAPREAEGCGFCMTPVMSYVPVQKWGSLYEPEEGLERGTIFPVLDYPFCGKGGQCK